MSSYCIDVDNPSVRWAMASLGIEANELLELSFHDFCIEGVSEDIAQLRFDHTRAKQQRTIEQIRQFQQEQRPRSLRQPARALTPSLLSSSPGPRPKPQVRGNKVVETLITQWTQQPAPRRSSSRTPDGQRRRKMRELRELQQANYQRMKRERDQFDREQVRLMTQTPPPATPLREASLHSSVLPNLPEVDDEVEAKLTAFERKLEKSQLLHSIKVEEKRLAAAKTSHKLPTTPGQETDEPLALFINKLKTIERRKWDLLQTQQEVRAKSREKHMERLHSAAQKARQVQTEHKMKARAVENRLARAAKLFSKQKEQLESDLLKRQELVKLKQEDVVQNNERSERAKVMLQ